MHKFVSVCSFFKFSLYFNRLIMSQAHKTEFCKMSSPNLLSPPSQIRGMKELDRSQFEKEITIPCVNLKHVTVSKVLPIFKKYLLKLNNFKSIKNENQSTTIFLNPNIVTKWDDLNADFKDLSINETNFEFKTQKLTYDNFTSDTVFKAILPNDQEGISSYTQIGHIIHVNLKKHLLPYKKVIGQVLIDKVSVCKTVVNKINNIDNAYRNFQMEILHGDNNTLVKVKENRCMFEFDFSKVFWNTRLCTEHERIVNSLNAGDVLFDIFAGVGPFSIPSAKKKCFVYANDINPESYKWLKHNASINKINDIYLSVFNKDGQNFIQEDVKRQLLKHINNNKIYIVMNLPAIALEFLNGFFNLYTENELQEVFNPPMIYVYCFAKGNDPIEITKESLLKATGRDITDKIVDIQQVRNVSSCKEMMRITIKLDTELLLAKKRKCESIDFLSVKKCCNGEEKQQERL